MVINLTITVRGINTDSYNGAKEFAYAELMEKTPELLGQFGIRSYLSFLEHARVARETDQTFTVTIP